MHSYSEISALKYNHLCERLNNFLSNKVVAEFQNLLPKKVGENNFNFNSVESSTYTQKQNAYHAQYNKMRYYKKQIAPSFREPTEPPSPSGAQTQPVALDTTAHAPAARVTQADR